jgi:hypothetical protein
MICKVGLKQINLINSLMLWRSVSEQGVEQPLKPYCALTLWFNNVSRSSARDKSQRRPVTPSNGISRPCRGGLRIFFGHNTPSPSRARRYSSTDQWSSRCPHNTNQDEKFLSNQIVPFFFFFPKQWVYIKLCLRM